MSMRDGLPASYFELDQEGKPYLHPDFVSQAKVGPLAEAMARGGPRLTISQLRRFFNYCREIERRLNVDGETWSQVAADFVSLEVHAQYASSGRNRKIPVEFRQFIVRNVGRVTSYEDPRFAFIRGFIPHFEALVGFGTGRMRDS